MNQKAYKKTELNRKTYIYIKKTGPQERMSHEPNNKASAKPSELHPLLRFCVQFSFYNPGRRFGLTWTESLLALVDAYLGFFLGALDHPKQLY